MRWLACGRQVEAVVKQLIDLCWDWWLPIAARMFCHFSQNVMHRFPVTQFWSKRWLKADQCTQPICESACREVGQFRESDRKKVILVLLRLGKWRPGQLPNERRPAAKWKRKLSQ